MKGRDEQGAWELLPGSFKVFPNLPQLFVHFGQLSHKVADVNGDRISASAVNDGIFFKAPYRPVVFSFTFGTINADFLGV